MGVALQAVLEKYKQAEIKLVEQAIVDALVAAIADYAPAAYQSEVQALEGLVLPVIQKWLDEQVAKLG